MCLLLGAFLRSNSWNGMVVCWNICMYQVLTFYYKMQTSAAKIDCWTYYMHSCTLIWYTNKLKRPRLIKHIYIYIVSPLITLPSDYSSLYISKQNSSNKPFTTWGNSQCLWAEKKKPGHFNMLKTYFPLSVSQLQV